MTEKNDILKDLFSQMPEEELPASFRANAMRQIMAEAERIRKRNERWGWIAVIAASLLMVGIAIASFLYMNIPPISVQIPNMSTLPFYAYIGMLAPSRSAFKISSNVLAVAPTRKRSSFPFSMIRCQASETGMSFLHLRLQ